MAIATPRVAALQRAHSTRHGRPAASKSRPAQGSLSDSDSWSSHWRVSDSSAPCGDIRFHPWSQFPLDAPAVYNQNSHTNVPPGFVFLALAIAAHPEMSVGHYGHPLTPRLNVTGEELFRPTVCRKHLRPASHPPLAEDPHQDNDDRNPT